MQKHKLLFSLEEFMQQIKDIAHDEHERTIDIIEILCEKVCVQFR